MNLSRKCLFDGKKSGRSPPSALLIYFESEKVSKQSETKLPRSINVLFKNNQLIVLIHHLPGPGHGRIPAWSFAPRSPYRVLLLERFLPRSDFTSHIFFLFLPSPSSPTLPSYSHVELSSFNTILQCQSMGSTFFSFFLKTFSESIRCP